MRIPDIYQYCPSIVFLWSTYLTCVGVNRQKANSPDVGFMPVTLPAVRARLALTQPFGGKRGPSTGSPLPAQHNGRCFRQDVTSSSRTLGTGWRCCWLKLSISSCKSGGQCFVSIHLLSHVHNRRRTLWSDLYVRFSDFSDSAEKVERDACPSPLSDHVVYSG